MVPTGPKSVSLLRRVFPYLSLKIILVEHNLSTKITISIVTFVPCDLFIVTVLPCELFSCDLFFVTYFLVTDFLVTYLPTISLRHIFLESWFLVSFSLGPCLLCLSFSYKNEQHLCAILLDGQFEKGLKIFVEMGWFWLTFGPQTAYIYLGGMEWRPLFAWQFPLCFQRIISEGWRTILVSRKLHSFWSSSNRYRQ